MTSGEFSDKKCLADILDNLEIGSDIGDILPDVEVLGKQDKADGLLTSYSLLCARCAIAGSVGTDEKMVLNIRSPRPGCLKPNFEDMPNNVVDLAAERTKRAG